MQISGESINTRLSQRCQFSSILAREVFISYCEHFQFPNCPHKHHASQSFSRTSNDDATDYSDFFFQKQQSQFNQLIMCFLMPSPN